MRASRTSRPSTADIGAIAPEGARRWPRLSDWVKRSIDVLAAAALFVLLLPVFVVIALAVKLESRGPVFYTATRVGRRGVTFGLLKFRKMRADVVGPPLTAADDTRFTRIGMLLARYRLDELPQLLNVLRGHMSFVGPRPEDPAFVGLRPDEFHEVLTVRPGITGWTQLIYVDEASLLVGPDPVERYVSELLPRKVQLDQLYARTWSVLCDLKLLVWTPLVVLLGWRVERDLMGVLRLRRRPASLPPRVAEPARVQASLVIDLRDAVIDLRELEPEATQLAH